MPFLLRKGGGGGITINSGVQPKAMWVAKSLSPVMAAPNTLQIGLRCVFSICFFLSSSFTKYLWKAMEIPYNFSYKSYQLRNMWFFKMLNCRIHFIHHHVYCLKLQIDSKTKTRKWHDTDIKKNPSRYVHGFKHRVIIASVLLLWFSHRYMYMYVKEYDCCM